MKTQHHLMRLILAASCFFFAIGLYAQITIEEVWADLRPVDGVSEWIMEGNGTSIKRNYITFTIQHKYGVLSASYAMDPEIQPDGRPSPQQAQQKSLHQTDVGGRSLVTIVDNKSVPSQKTNLRDEVGKWTMSYRVLYKGWAAGQFKGSLSEDGETINGTYEIEAGKEVPVVMRRRVRR